ncbi:MAG: hypothetical protein LBG06_01325 [Deltaproteobacteria bacterium]|jgi:hypothetical protein|nr:hypothetical protein [Deltaproteobacteria bacterium]
MMTIEETSALAAEITAMSELFGRPGLSSAVIGIYEDILDPLGFEAASGAIRRAMKTETFMPPPARLLEIAGAAPARDAGDAAYGILFGLFRGWAGHDEVYLWPDAAAVEALRRMGKPVEYVICGKERLGLVFQRDAFRSLYRAASGEGARGPAPLAILAPPPPGADGDGPPVVQRCHYPPAWTPGLVERYAPQLEAFYGKTPYSLPVLRRMAGGMSLLKALEGAPREFPDEEYVPERFAVPPPRNVPARAAAGLLKG